MDIYYSEDINVNKLVKTRNLILMTILYGVVSLSFAATCLATDPPAEGMVVWFKADAGVSQDLNGVTVWQDQSGNNNHASRIDDPNIGSPQLATATFPSGSHDVLRFDGNGALRLTDASATQLTDFNIFIVASYDTGSVNKRVFGNYSIGNGATQYGYGLGTNPTGASDWWYAGSTELSTNVPYEADVNYLTVYTLANSNMKQLFNFHEVDGFAGSVSETAAAPIQYYTGTELPPHYCDIGVLWIDYVGYYWYGAHTGDIAEILVYDIFDPDYIALGDPNAAFDDVRTYLNEKYGMDTSIPVIDPNAIVPDPDIDAELVAYWPFDETTGDVAVDRSAYDNDGTLMGGFTFDTSSAADRLGNPTGALTFNGVGDWIDVLHDESIDCFPQVTIAAWVKVPGPEKAYATLVSKDLAIAVGTQYRAYGLMVHSVQSVMSWMANADYPGYVGNTTGTAGGVATGEWHHIAVTHDGTGITLYLDGQQDGLKVGMTGLNSTAPQHIMLGRGVPEFGDRFWAGNVDEIAIWDGALTPEEMLYVYESGVPLPPPGCNDIGVYFPADLNHDCYINLEDFAVIANDWLKCNDPQIPTCTDIP
jgi:hypothetical protein